MEEKKILVDSKRLNEVLDFLKQTYHVTNKRLAELSGVYSSDLSKWRNTFENSVYIDACLLKLLENRYCINHHYLTNESDEKEYLDLFVLFQKLFTNIKVCESSILNKTYIEFECDPDIIRYIIEIAKCSKNNDKLRENKIKELNNLYNKTTRVVYNKNGIKLNRFKRKATLELKPYSIDTELSEQIIYFNTSFRSTSEQQDIEEEKNTSEHQDIEEEKNTVE